MTDEKTTMPLRASLLSEGLERLLPCPFCGSGNTQIDQFRVWMGNGWGEPITVSVNHWCAKIEGQPSRKIERIGKDLESAIAAWNMRSNAKLTSPPTTAGATEQKA